MKNKTIAITLYLLIIMNMLFVLIPFAEGGSFLGSYASSEEFKQLNLKYLLIINLVLYAIAIFKSRIDLNDSLVRVIVLISIVYVVVNWYQGSLAHYFSLVALPFAYLALFYVFPKYQYSRKLFHLVYLILVIWTIYPLLFIFVSPDSMQAFNFLDKAGLNTFRGFAYHRNVYAFYAGLTLLLTLNIQKTTYRYFKFAIIIMLTIGLLLSESRSGIVAVFISSMYYYYKTAPRKGIYIFKASILTIVLLVFLDLFILPNSIRGMEQIFNISDRLFISRELLSRNSSSLIFGSGVGTLLANTTVNDISAHNFVVQTILDYGIFVAGLFFFIIYKVWITASKQYQTSLLFLILVGLSQPYFSFGVPTYFTLMTLLIAQSAEQEFGNES